MHAKVDAIQGIECLRCRCSHVERMDNTPFPMPGWGHCHQCNAIFPLDLAAGEQQGDVHLPPVVAEPVLAMA